MVSRSQPFFPREASVTTPLGPKQTVTSEELLRSQMLQQEALIRLLIMKGLFTQEEFLEMVKTVDEEIKRNKG